MNRILLFTAAGGALLWISRMLSAKQLSDNSLVRILRPRISTTNWIGVTLLLDVQVDNPTNKSVFFTSPVVTITSKGQFLASSTPTRRSFNIEPLSRNQLSAIEVVLPWSSLIRYSGGMLSRFQNLPDGQRTLENLTLPLEYTYSTYVNGILYESPSERIL
jgi:hypothetical protein